MKSLVCNHSSYPLSIEDGPETDTREAVRSAVQEQESAGVDVATDGRSSWGDSLCRTLRNVEGARPGDLRPFLDSGTAFHPPVIESKLRWSDSPSVEDYRQTATGSQRLVKPVLLGPYTTAGCAQIETPAYEHMADLAADWSLILASEVGELARAGARLIQIDEPLILRHPEHCRLLRDLLEPLKVAAGDVCQLMIATYFGDAEPLYAQLESLPADIVAVDLVESRQLGESIARFGSGKILALGVTNGRSPVMEDFSSLTHQIERILHRYVHDVVYLQPSCGLASLSTQQARAKLAVLASVREALALNERP